ncbi:T9SS ring complex lipoprotein PorK/GldK [Olivibacter domesticus]|uniref:Gliding motility-associated lipoprotein GldK/gliding motility-associated lipoprotein GldK,TIGR03529 n=1 Tax=Olivibacter domesticus TaxID=407022 RepID=A0A1H7X9G4_OLID1|nr:SUMF1/EgtB/PvdO family nonheme iron enzyme [Olivibacter domesticus]SEM30323.1 gliding motility-associated lipoprotein GldK/gliding motility-associated lipoprotein GldK,TIGR03529 [Olivibacter domesticus]
MRKIYYCYFVLVSLVLVLGCGNRKAGGELTGVRLKGIKANKAPKGMVLIPAGSFIAGLSDEDITSAQIAQNRQFTQSAFFMDETEISNSQYRQFVNWVRDSIAITQYLNDPSFFVQNAEGDNGGQRFIDWSKVGDGTGVWGKKNDNKDALNQMYYQGDDRIFGRDELDVRLLKYHYEIYNHRMAAANKNNKSMRRSDFIIRDTIGIYPDTLVWLADFSYAQNEPLVEGYFSHPAFQDYPVVGVNWRQARAFAVWRTRLYENYAQKVGLPRLSRLSYELPSEHQWEYAARGGLNGAPYPWGGPTIRNAKGCLMANFKPGRGNYADDGGAYTVPVHSYFPNDYGLYNMAGNVAEWTASSFEESSSSFVHDMNPTYSYEAKANDAEILKRKVVRGGSWKDIGYFLQNSTRTYEYQDTAKSYIGFRCVTSYAGRDL